MNHLSKHTLILLCILSLFPNLLNAITWHQASGFTRAYPELWQELQKKTKMLENNQVYIQKQKAQSKVYYYDYDAPQGMVRYFQNSCKKSVTKQTGQKLLFDDTSYLDYDTQACARARDMVKRFNKEQADAIEQYRKLEAELYKEQDYKNYQEISEHVENEFKKYRESKYGEYQKG